MKKFFLTVLAAICFSLSSSAQFVDYLQPRPTFMGGDANSFRKWVQERIVYDPEAKAEGVRGRVTLQFTIEVDGTLDNVKVLRGIDPRLDAEAVRVVSSSPKWKHTADNPKPITYTFPVIFKHDRPFPYPREKFQYGEEDYQTADVYCVAHGSLVIEVFDQTIFIDPVWKIGDRISEYGWFRPYDNTTILLTHEHFDHLSRETIDYLTDVPGKTFSIYGNRKSIETLGEGSVLDNGDTLSIHCFNQRKDNPYIRIKAVPAYNTTVDHRKFHPKGNGNGYIIEAGKLRIYVAGDTEYIPEMKRLGRIDVAFLPVNQPYTMTPEQCIEAARAIRPAVLIPYHMGDTDMSPVIKAFEGSGTKVILHEELR